jgi:hypothetical protein
MFYKFYDIRVILFLSEELALTANHFSFRTLFHDAFGTETLRRRMIGCQVHHDELEGSNNGLTETLSRHLPGGD